MFRLSAKRFNSNAAKFIKKSVEGKVALLELNRPEALNSLNSQLIEELIANLEQLQADEEVSAAVITGSNKSFAAGADIAEMSEKSYSACFRDNFLSNWTKIASFRKPLIAAVNGYALGGGFELALMCDIIYAGSRAKFGLPEIKLGTIPGGGGTQRLIRAVGKSNAMEMVLTGKHISAEEALKLGIVSRVLEEDKLVKEALELAKDMSKYSLLALEAAKEAILKAEETGLSIGLDYERKLFHGTFATSDKFEGMNAFLHKRKPEFKNE